MITREYTITAPEGIHARPAAALIRLVKPFKSAVTVKSGNKAIALNSMLNLLALGTRGGQSIIIEIEGVDEVDAALAIETFFQEQLNKL